MNLPFLQRVPLAASSARGVAPQCSFSVTSIDTAVVDGIILRGSLLLPEGAGKKGTTNVVERLWGGLEVEKSV